MPSLASLIARAHRSLGDHLGRLGRSFESLADNHRAAHDRRTGARPRPPAPGSRVGGQRGTAEAALFQPPPSGRVEGWRAHGRVRWRIHGFRRGPQSGSPGHVSNPRHVERSRRISRTPLSGPLHAKAYATDRSGSAVGGDYRATTYATWPARPGLPPGVEPPLQVLQMMGAFIRAPLPPMLAEEARAAGPLRSTGITPLRRYYGPIRHPLVVGRLPGVAGSTAYPASADFAAGRGGLLQLLAVSWSPCGR